MRSKYQNEVLEIAFSGELDNLEIINIRDTIIKMIDQSKPKIVRFDFNEVTFVDSTGIGFLLARYNQVKKYNGELVVANLSHNVQKIFALSGIFKIIKIENKKGVTL